MKLHLKLSLIILDTDLFPSLSALQLINELIKIINLNQNLTATPYFGHFCTYFRDFLKRLLLKIFVESFWENF